MWGIYLWSVCQIDETNDCFIRCRKKELSLSRTHDKNHWKWNLTVRSWVVRFELLVGLGVCLWPAVRFSSYQCIAMCLYVNMFMSYLFIWCHTYALPVCMFAYLHVYIRLYLSKTCKKLYFHVTLVTTSSPRFCTSCEYLKYRIDRNCLEESSAT